MQRSPPASTPAINALLDRLSIGLPDSTYMRAEEFFATRSANIRRSETAKADLQRLEQQKALQAQEQRMRADLQKQGSSHADAMYERGRVQKRPMYGTDDTSHPRTSQSQSQYQVPPSDRPSREVISAHEAQIEIERQRMREHIRREKEKAKQREIGLTNLAQRLSPPSVQTASTAMPRSQTRSSPEAQQRQATPPHQYQPKAEVDPSTMSEVAVLLPAADLMSELAEVAARSTVIDRRTEAGRQPLTPVKAVTDNMVERARLSAKTMKSPSPAPLQQSVFDTAGLAPAAQGYAQVSDEQQHPSKRLKIREFPFRDVKDHVRTLSASASEISISTSGDSRSRIIDRRRARNDALRKELAERKATAKSTGSDDACVTPDLTNDSAGNSSPEAAACEQILEDSPEAITRVVDDDIAVPMTSKDEPDTLALSTRNTDEDIAVIADVIDA